MNIRSQLKAYYQQEKALAVPTADLRLIRESIADYQRRLTDDFPTYGVARASDGGRGNAISDPTPGMAQEYAVTRRMIRKEIIALQREEHQVMKVIRETQRQNRLMEIALSHISDDARRLLEMRYKQECTLEHIAAVLFSATEAHTAAYHLGRAEEALTQILSPSAPREFRRKRLTKVLQKSAKIPALNMVLCL